MDAINLWSVLAATIGSFIFGALWYSPLLFMRLWCQQTGVDPTRDMPNPARVYGLTFVLTLLACYVFALLLGPAPALATAMQLAALLAIGLIAASLGINYQFANNSLLHWLIDSGFHLGRFMVMGLVLWCWY